MGRKPKGGQGQGEVTADKERRIGAAISVNMKIAENRFGDFQGKSYWHFDANAGSGDNDSLSITVPGSPVVFWEAAERHLSGLKARPYFCDNDPDAIRALTARLASRGLDKRSVIHCCDNEVALAAFERQIRASRENPRHAIGSVVVDPNGYFYRSAEGNGAPVESLIEFTRAFKKIDVIINMNMRIYAMQAERGHKGLMSPLEVFAKLNKQHWLVARAGRRGSRFLLAIGRNFETGDHKRLQLYKLDSPQGAFIVEHAANTKQPGAFDYEEAELPGLFESTSPKQYNPQPQLL
jgi:hypothetical protein